ncbi:MAG: hypothetical protein ACI9HK_001309 [Pirellulaceae bacterium]|jgi:hypothetical protein
MQRMRIYFVIASALTLASLSRPNSCLAEKPRELQKLLCVGNSYTRGIKPGVDAFMMAHQKEIQLKYITPGGRQLSQHLKHAGTTNEIRTGKWDVVMLQEQSQAPALPVLRDSFLESGKQLCKIVRDSGAQPILFTTWGRRDGDKANRSHNPDFETMQKRLTEAYQELGAAAKAAVIPIGPAWAALKERDEKLWRKLYAKDGSHPSAYGAYLSGAVLYASLTGNNPRQVHVVLNGVTVEEAFVLCEVAAQVALPEKRGLH